MAATNHERIGKALILLSEGLAPFVARECQAKYGESWVLSVARLDPNPGTPGKKVLAGGDRRPVHSEGDLGRMAVGLSQRPGSDRSDLWSAELRDVRNRWAHQDTLLYR